MIHNNSTCVLLQTEKQRNTMTHTAINTSITFEQEILDMIKDYII